MVLDEIIQVQIGQNIGVHNQEILIEIQVFFGKNQSASGFQEFFSLI
ncbi:hypothetical protein SDC9_193744 [bioreactor metagenome]|uniref:Uncharacterized protein n=1 Tax=bioreactor metagenome TaxID=1076179 RepID=A0A645I4E7_9ZZZZ